MKHIMLPFDPITVTPDAYSIRVCAFPQRPCRLEYLFLDPSPGGVLADWMITSITTGCHRLLAISAGGIPATAFALPDFARHLGALVVDGLVRIEVAPLADGTAPPLPIRFAGPVSLPGMVAEIQLQKRHRAEDRGGTVHPVMLGIALDS